MKNCLTLPLSTVIKLTIWKRLSNLIKNDRNVID